MRQEGMTPGRGNRSRGRVRGGSLSSQILEDFQKEDEVGRGWQEVTLEK